MVPVYFSTSPKASVIFTPDDGETEWSPDEADAFPFPSKRVATAWIERHVAPEDRLCVDPLPIRRRPSDTVH